MSIEGTDANDTWRMLKNVQPTGPASRDEGGAVGQVDMATGLEKHPCFMCKSWEKDTPKLVRHFQAWNIVVNPDGAIETPIAKNIPGRRSMKLQIQQMGWCRFEARPTDDLATCVNFRQVRTREDLRARMELVGRRVG